MTPTDLLEEWAERAAIMQYDSKATREEAEAMAWERMREKYGAGVVSVVRKV